MRGGASESAIETCRQYGFDISVGYTKLSKNTIDRLHAAGIKVGTWDISDQRLMDLYVDFGVDFITTDLLRR